MVKSEIEIRWTLQEIKHTTKLSAEYIKGYVDALEYVLRTRTLKEQMEYLVSH